MPELHFMAGGDFEIVQVFDKSGPGAAWRARRGVGMVKPIVE